MNEPSTERVRQFRDRQAAAGRKRITLYLDHKTHCKLHQLSGDRGQASYLETLVKAAIEREWTVLASRRNDGEPRQRLADRRTVFLGRRRSLAEG